VKELAGGEGDIYVKSEGLLMPRKRSIKMIKLKKFLIMAIIKISSIEMAKKGQENNPTKGDFFIQINDN